MDKFKQSRFKQLTENASDANEANRAKLFLAAPTLEAVTNGKIDLSSIDPDIDKVITELYKLDEEDKLSPRQQLLFKKLTGQIQ